MTKLLIILICTVLGITSHSLGQTQIESDSQVFKMTMRVLPFIGSANSGAGEVQVGPFPVNGKSYDASQYGISIEWMFVTEGIKIGLGGGLYYRYGNSFPDSVNKVSTKLYSAFEIGNNKKRKLVSFNLQLGVVDGSISNKYVFYLGCGPVFNIQKQFNRINFSLYPSFEYHGSEQQEGSYLDSRNPPGHQTEYTYFLSFTTLSFNLAIIVQYNFLKSTP